MPRRLVEFLEDKKTNELSAIRLAMLLWAVGTLGIWIYASIRSGTLAEIPDSVVTVLAIVLGGKAVQRFGER